MNLDYEHEVQGPFVNPKFPKQVYWKSEATTLTAVLYDQDELKEKDILEYLRDIKMEGWEKEWMIIKTVAHADIIVKMEYAGVQEVMNSLMQQ